MGTIIMTKISRQISSGTQTTSRIDPAWQLPAATVRQAMGDIEDLGQNDPDGQVICVEGSGQ